MTPKGRQLLWFTVYWLCGVGVLGVVALVIRSVLA